MIINIGIDRMIMILMTCLMIMKIETTVLDFHVTFCVFLVYSHNYYV